MSKSIHTGGKGSKKGRFIVRACLTLFVISFALAPTILHNYFGYKISPILSGSMSPFAEPGDVFITIDRPASVLKVGDIVTLYSENSMKLYAHRIVDVRQFNGQIKIVTKGDANPSEDSDPYLVSPETKVPVTLFRAKEIGNALVYMTSLQGRQAGLILVVVANVLALLLSMFKKKIRERNLRAEQIYKDLFAEASSEKSAVIKKTQMFKELYAESQNKLQANEEK